MTLLERVQSMLDSQLAEIDKLEFNIQEIPTKDFHNLVLHGDLTWLVDNFNVSNLNAAQPVALRVWANLMRYYVERNPFGNKGMALDIYLESVERLFISVVKTEGDVNEYFRQKLTKVTEAFIAYGDSYSEEVFLAYVTDLFAWMVICSQICVMWAKTDAATQDNLVLTSPPLNGTLFESNPDYNKDKVPMTPQQLYLKNQHNIGLDFMVTAKRDVLLINRVAGKDLEAFGQEPNLGLFCSYLSNQINITCSEIEEGIVSLTEGKTAKEDSSGFRDDLMDIVFTASGILSFTDTKLADIIPKIGRHTVNVVVATLMTDTPVPDNITHCRVLKILLDAFNNVVKNLQDLRNHIQDENGVPVGILAYEEAAQGLAMLTLIYAGYAVKVYGYNLIADWDAVVVSNYSKFDTQFEDIGKSCAKYFDQGIVVQPRLSPCGRYYAYISPFDQEVNGKKYPKNKFLKSHRFAEPIYHVTEEVATDDIHESV